MMLKKLVKTIETVSYTHLTKTSILNVTIAGIDGLSVIIEYMHFGEDKISKYQYFLRVDEYYKWKQLSSIQEQIFLKADSVISNNRCV